MPTIYRIVSYKELLLWQEGNILNINNSIQNEGLFIPYNIYHNYQDNIPKGVSFYYKLEQVLTGNLYQPNADCIISLSLPDDVLSKFAVVGHYFGYISNGMKTAYEYLLPKEVLQEYIGSFSVICDSKILLHDLMSDFRREDDSKEAVRRFAEWPERTLSLNTSSNLGDIEWLLEQFFGTKFIHLTNGLLFPSEDYILTNQKKFNFHNENVGYNILQEAINDPTYYNFGKSNRQFILPHPSNSVFGYIGKKLLEQGYKTEKDLLNKKEELLKYYKDGANQVFNDTYEKSKFLQRIKF